MRTNILIDDALMTEALRVTGLPTKKAVVEEALGLSCVSGRKNKPAPCAAAFNGKAIWTPCAPTAWTTV